MCFSETAELEAFLCHPPSDILAKISERIPAVEVGSVLHSLLGDEEVASRQRTSGAGGGHAGSVLQKLRAPEDSLMRVPSL